MSLFYEGRDDGWKEAPAEIKGTYLDNFKNVWDLYINNSKYDKKTLATGGYDAEAEFKKGEAVFYQNGTWEYDALKKSISDDDMQMIPIYCGVEGEEKAGLCSGTENCWAVNAKASKADQKATLEFMKWLVTSKEGTKVIMEYYKKENKQAIIMERNINEETLKVCQKYQVLYRISNYAKALPRLHQSHMKLIKKLQEYGIEYKLYDEDGYWIDYGFDYLNKDMDEEELTQTFDRCLTPCREVRGNKLYFCVMARSVSDNLHFNEGQDDYLDLELLKSDNYKKVLLEFNLGYSEKGYLDMCHRCHGIDAVNYPIPIAEQLYGEDK